MLGPKRISAYLVASMLLASACGGDGFVGAETDTASGTDTDSGTASAGTDSGTTGGATDSAGTAGTDSATSGGSTGGTGGDVNLGHRAVAFVNAGGVSESASFRLVWTFGQSSQNQNTMQSAGFTLHGGLVGAAE